MSTYLQLVQALHREVGAAGAAPQSVLNQTGEARRLVSWVADADLDVQNLWVNWKFLRSTAALTTVAGQATLTGVSAGFPANLAEWDPDTFKITPPGGDEQPLDCFEYETVRSEVLDTTQQQPWRVILMPDGTLRFEGVPDAAYAITADYYRAPARMAANTDTSPIPVRFERVILGRAIILYGNFEQAPEQIKQGQEIYADYLTRLENSQLPNRFNSRFRTGSDIVIRPE